jgi:hypothetical protein
MNLPFMNTLSVILAQMTPTRPAAYPWAMVLLVAVLAGIAMGFLSSFWPAGNDNRRTRDRLRARMMELLLHDGSFGSMAGTIRDLWRETIPLLTAEIPRAVIGVVAIGIPAIWLSGWIEMRPLELEQTTIVKASVEPSLRIQDIALVASEGLAVETTPLCFQNPTAVSWRIRVLNSCPDTAWVELTTPSARTRIPVFIERGTSPNHQPPVITTGRHPAMNVPGRQSHVARLCLTYPEASLEVGGHPISWLFVYLTVAWILSWIAQPVRSGKGLLAQ